MSIVSSRGTRTRAAFLAAATVLAVGVMPSQALADGGGADSAPASTKDTLGLIRDDVGEPSEVVTTHPDWSYTYVGSRTASGFADTLSVGTPAFTGAYKTIVSGPHVTQVKVYRRSVKACHGEELGLVVQCLSGSIVYAAGFAACFSGCTVGGQRGSQVCATDGSGNFPGYSASLVSCYNQLYGTGPAAGSGSKAVEVDKVCNQGPVQACVTKSWHLNAYPTGNVTGPYGGEGNA